MKAYSKDLRERIVTAVHQGHHVRDVAERYDVHPRTVWRYLRLEREQGHLDPRPRQGRAPKLTPEQQQAFRQQLDDHPGLTYPERARLFFEQHGVRLSGPTISRLRKRLRYSRKKSGSAP